MVPYEDLEKGDFRLLDVDSPLVLPYGVWIRILVTSVDVIHCWAVPRLGVKIDGVPGRLNCVPLYIKKPGVFYGQCREICGPEHAFMPVVVESIDLKDYVV